MWMWMCEDVNLKEHHHKCNLKGNYTQQKLYVGTFHSDLRPTTHDPQLNNNRFYGTKFLWQYRSRGHQYWISMCVIEMKTKRPLWSQHYDAELLRFCYEIAMRLRLAEVLVQRRPHGMENVYLVRLNIELKVLSWFGSTFIFISRESTKKI